MTFFASISPRLRAVVELKIFKPDIFTVVAVYLLVLVASEVSLSVGIR